MQKLCANSWCSQPFEVTEEDLAFYEKVSPVFNGKKELIPPPTRCPECRMQRRLSFRNERALYKRPCDLSGEQIITMYPKESRYKVYRKAEWFSDMWDPLSFGREVDLSRSFIEQFADLFARVPKMSLIQQSTMENAEYCNRASNDKNCYMIFTSNFSEDCYYSVHLTNCRNCIDCLNTHKSELCYECVDCYECYNGKWLESCKNCSDSFFLKGCVGCKDCMFCTNLSQKQYCVFNKQYSEQEYREHVSRTELHRRSVIELLRAKFHDLKRTMTVRSYVGLNNEHVSGNYLDHCKNSLDCFECRETEDCKYCQSLTEAKDCMDYVSWGRGCELIYETANCGYNCRNILFSNECWENNQDLLYCNQCLNSSHLFGCCGLRYKQYCILNRQYAADEYEDLVPKIIDVMRAQREWGEFFPGAMSPFAYNETNANDYLPLSVTQARAQGWRWLDVQEIIEGNPAQGIPDSVDNANDGICSDVFRCSETRRYYKIIPQELECYRKMRLPIPDRSFDERHRRRLLLQNPRKLWNRTCANCHKPIATSYAPDRPEKVVCEECYLKEVH